jgi:hypothetical protein
MPIKDTVIVICNVVFEPTLFFNRIDSYASTSVIKEVIKLLKYLDILQDNDVSIKDLLTAR